MSGLFANLQEYWMVYLLMAIYTLALAYHGWKGNRETKGVADYYIGGRAMGGVAVLGSFAAGISTLLLWNYAPFSRIVHEVFPAVILSLLVYVAVSFATDANAAEEVERLFPQPQHGM